MDRYEQELDILVRISQILGDGMELSEVFQRAMALLSEKMNIQHAALVLWNEATDEARTIAAIGLSADKMQRGRYALGEGVTGQVMATGQTMIIPDVQNDTRFLNRTGAGDSGYDAQMSFLCVPVKDADKRVGAISVHKPFVDDPSLKADARLLNIVAGSFAQTIRIHHLLQADKQQLLDENRQLRGNLHSKYKFDNIIGSAPAMLDVFAVIALVASSRATCLLLGETGCGKELIAKAIHYNSPRKDKPLIRVNCGALSPQLLESELFGHVKGAFTGAMRDKVGRFEAADGGSIFLDEVGTLDLQMQVKLLRVLQEREIERVGDHHSIKIDCRIIAATNIELEEAVRNGAFREDLYYRLNVVTIHVPPLRNRREDIPQLIDFFLDKYNLENGRSLCKLSRELLNTLMRYPWPGNVRELENAVERAVVLSQGEQFTESILPLQIRLFSQQVRGNTGDESLEVIAAKLAHDGMRRYAGCEGEIYDLVVQEVEKQLIRCALEQNTGIKTRAADFLGINRNTLNKKVKELGIESK